MLARVLLLRFSQGPSPVERERERQTSPPASGRRPGAGRRDIYALSRRRLSVDLRRLLVAGHPGPVPSSENYTEYPTDPSTRIGIMFKSRVSYVPFATSSRSSSISIPIPGAPGSGI